MKNVCFTVLTLGVLLYFIPSLGAQAVYTGYQKSHIQAGVGFLYLDPDYAQKNVQGVSFWGDYDVRPWIGAEASVHLGSIITPDDIAESSYMIGPRLIYHKRKFTVYGKLLFGRATITNQQFNLSSSYNAYSFGGGVEYRVTRKINIRALDAEFQQWPNFEPNTLSPLAITIGASYIIR